MTYELFPAVDEDFNFPIEVRKQLAKSEQLRNLVVPMSEVQRDSLTNDELWFGRVIYNTTSEALESWKAPGVWVEHLDETYSFPQPPPFWDENYDVPVEVRQQLAKSQELRGLITPMTLGDRDNLTTQERWNGRTIFNLSLNRLEVWKSSLNNWFELLDASWNPPQTPWNNWNPVLSTYIPGFEGSEEPPVGWTSAGRYVHMDNIVNCYFVFNFYGSISSEDDTSLALEVNVPVVPVNPGGTNPLMDSMAEGRLILHIGTGVDIKSGFTEFDRGGIVLNFIDTDGVLKPVKTHHPVHWTSNMSIKGHLSYITDFDRGLGS